MSFKHKKLFDSTIIDNYGTRISNLETDVDVLKKFNGLSKSSVTFYVCPANASDSHTFKDTSKTEKLIGSDDDNVSTGEIDKPFATVAHAVSKLQQFRAIAPITFKIYLHAGIYKYTTYEVNNNGSIGIFATLSWMVRHCDTVVGSGCYFHIEGFAWSGHVESTPTDTNDPRYNDFDTDSILVDGVDNPADELYEVVFDDTRARKDANRNIILNNPVIVEIAAKAANAGAHCALAFQSPAVLDRITFRMHPGRGAFTNNKTNEWPVYQYSANTLNIRYCKFLNFANGAVNVEDFSRGSNASSAIEYCYFDNAKLFNGDYAEYSGSDTGIRPPYAINYSPTLRVTNCRFRYFVTGIKGPNLALYSLETPYIRMVDGVAKTIYRRNVITFEECTNCMLVNNIAFGYAWSSGNTFIDENQTYNIKFKFVNNATTRDYKVRTQSNNQNYT